MAGAVLPLSASFSSAAEPSTRFPGKTWERRTPGEAGLDEGKLNAFIRRLATPAKDPGDGPTSDDPDFSGCIIKDGYMVASWGEPSRKFSWFSASKPVLSTLLFFAVQEGKLKGVDDRISDWGRKLSEKDKSMTFAHLANMVSGYTLKEPPGAAWAYNDFAIRLYVVTLDRVFGGNGLNEPARRLFENLQLEDGDVFGDTQKVVTSPRDFARIGWLWMHKGNWNGREVLAREFFERYMKPQVPSNLPRARHEEPDDYLQVGSYGGGNNHWEPGPGLYGFNWWFNAPMPKSGGLYWPTAPPDTFAALGGNNIMIMIPSRNLLVAAHGYWGREDGGDPNSRFNENLKLLVDAVKE
jgi:CubicO group peptidase (beta-lactamase class C family)